MDSYSQNLLVVLRSLYILFVETPINVPVIPNPVTGDSASVTATIASCTHTTSVSKTDVTIVPASTTHSATTEDTHIIPTASISFNSTPTCTATTTMPSNDAKCPPLADKSDETTISLGKSHHHKQLLLLCM